LRAGFSLIECPNVVKFLQIFHDLLPFRHGKKYGLGGLIFIDDILWMKGSHGGDFPEIGLIVLVVSITTSAAGRAFGEGFC